MWNWMRTNWNCEKKDWVYDWMLYVIVPIQLGFIVLYCSLSSNAWEEIGWFERIGKIISMGILCGSFGINVAHELGHRNNRSEQFLAKVLLSTSLYMHFSSNTIADITSMWVQVKILLPLE